MKSQILKQSAIAFFVGSVISGTAFSADSQPASENANDDIKILHIAIPSPRPIIKEELDKFKNELKKEDENKANSTKSLFNIANQASANNKKEIDELSKDVDSNTEEINGINTELEEHQKDIMENAENINKVVDRVNENQKATDEAIKKVYETQDKLIDESTKLREDVENIGDALADHDKALDEKATKAEINTLKATLGEQLDKQKEELGKQAVSLHAKAGRQEMNEALDKKADVAELDKLTEDVAKDLDDQEMRLDDHEKALKAVDNRVTENESNIATINENLVQLAEKSDVMSDQLNATTEGVEENSKAITELKATKEYMDAKKVEDSFKEVNEDLDNISDAVKTNGENIEGLDGNIKANSDKISENAEGLQALANAQNELSDAHEALADLHDGLRSEHNALDKTVKENKADADKRFKATGEALKHIAGKLGDTETKLANDIDTVGKDLGVTKKASDDNANNIRRNLSSIQANSRLGNANHADIADLQTKVATHTTQISQNSHRIDQVNSRVDRLQKEVKRGLAAQAALTGLFQPYKVGHANFTAAVGGYKSQTAVAVGTGYRFNENVAAKAGVAFSTNGGGAAYNAGVNFEW